MVNDFLVRTNYKTNSICSPLMRPEVYNHRSPLLCCGWLVWGKAPPPMCGLDKIRHTPQLTSRSAGQIGQTIARILKKWKSQDSKCTSYSEPSKYFIAGRFSKSEKSILLTTIFGNVGYSRNCLASRPLWFKRASRSVCLIHPSIRWNHKVTKTAVQVSSKLTIVCLRVLPML